MLTKLVSRARGAVAPSIERARGALTPSLAEYSGAGLMSLSLALVQLEAGLFLGGAWIFAFGVVSGSTPEVAE